MRCKLPLILFISLTLLFQTSIIHAQTTQLTNLPTLYITTDGAIPVDSKTDWRTGNLSIAAPTGTEGLYSGAIEIRGRGNSTWGLSKKPYRIRLASKYNLLGLPAKEKNWVLLANYADKTLMRNAVALEISKFMGLPYSPPYKFVDVFINGAYQGNYTLTDQIEVKEKRVEVDEQEPADVTQPSITGGYLLEADGFAFVENSWFTTSRGIRFTIHYPEDDEINSQQRNYITSYIQNIEDRLFSSNFRDPVDGYINFMDKTSLVNWYLASEITGNPDAFWSTYMFKKRDDQKLYFGPLWDFDISFNNDDRLGDATFKRMSENGHNAENRIWIERMLQDDDFKLALSVRWKALKAAGIHSFLNQLIPTMAATLDQSQILNHQQWGTLNTKVYREFYYEGPYMQQVEWMRQNLAKRLAWLEWKITGELGNETYYKIVNKVTGKVLAPGSDPLKLVQKTFASADNSHHWILSNVVSGGTKYYTLTNRSTGNSIQSPNNVSQSQLILSSEPVNASQQWQLLPLSDNIHFGFANRENGHAIENFNQNAADGNSIVQRSNNITSNESQQWQLVPTDLSSGPLPVYISGFQAVAKENGIVLSWHVHEQKNGSHFEIERFTNRDIQTFETIGKIPLTDAGIGRYEFTDNNAVPGINYYRLKQVDLDGSAEYSRIVLAKKPMVSQLSVWPLPAAGEASISFFSHEHIQGALEIYNVSGKKLLSSSLEIKAGSNTKSLDISTLSSGLYLVKILFDDEIETLKIVKTSNY